MASIAIRKLRSRGNTAMTPSMLFDVEDGFRTSSIPYPSPSALLFIRRLKLGSVEVGSSRLAWAKKISKALQREVTDARPISNSQAAETNAVWFRDRASFVEQYLVRRFIRADVGDWYWRSAISKRVRDAPVASAAVLLAVDAEVQEAGIVVQSTILETVLRFHAVGDFVQALDHLLGSSQQLGRFPNAPGKDAAQNVPGEKRGVRTFENEAGFSSNKPNTKAISGVRFADTPVLKKLMNEPVFMARFADSAVGDKALNWLVRVALSRSGPMPSAALIAKTVTAVISKARSSRIDKTNAHSPAISERERDTNAVFPSEEVLLSNVSSSTSRLEGTLQSKSNSDEDKRPAFDDTTAFPISVAMTGKRKGGAIGASKLTKLNAILREASGKPSAVSATTFNPESVFIEPNLSLTGAFETSVVDDAPSARREWGPSEIKFWGEGLPSEHSGFPMLLNVMHRAGILNLIDQHDWMVDCGLVHMVLQNLADMALVPENDPVCVIAKVPEWAAPQDQPAAFIAPPTWVSGDREIKQSNKLKISRLKGFPGWRVAFRSGHDLPMAVWLRQRPKNIAAFTVGEVQRGDPLSVVPSYSRFIAEGLAQRVRFFLENKLGYDLHSLVHRHGLIFHSRTHFDVDFGSATPPIELRLAGLDFNPGWMATMGKVISFHYRSVGGNDFG